MSVNERSKTNQYLTFTLDGEVFGVEIGKVREILDSVALTRVPQMPEFMRGVINLRGGVVPVIDLRTLFGLPQAERTAESCIIIVEVAMEGESTIFGAMADSVREVMDIDRDKIEPAPRIGARLKTDFIEGMGKQDDNFIILLDIDRVLSSEELTAVGGAVDLPTTAEVVGA